MLASLTLRLYPMAKQTTSPISPTKSFPVTWEELHRNAKALAWRLHDIHEKTPFTGVVAVTRGGLVPTTIVARELNIRLIETACIVAYDDRIPITPKLIKPPVAGDGMGWLVVDDLVDSGETTKFLRDLLPKAHFAALYAKPAGKAQADTFITEVSQDTWIYFPWDMEPQPIMPISGTQGL